MEDNDDKYAGLPESATKACSTRGSFEPTPTRVTSFFVTSSPDTAVLTVDECQVFKEKMNKE